MGAKNCPVGRNGLISARQAGVKVLSLLPTYDPDNLLLGELGHVAGLPQEDDDAHLHEADAAVGGTALLELKLLSIDE